MLPVEDSQQRAALRHWQRRILITSWLTYASLYLGRVNLAVALPTLQGELGWTKSETGWIGTAFFWVYALGQLVNGVLGDRWSPRLFVAAGLIGSAVANLSFGFSSLLPLLVLIWGANGYVQATGWGPIMRVLGNWFGRRQRARVTAIFGPCYTAGHVVSWLLAGLLIARVGWRAAFWAPAALLILSAAHWVWRVRDAPADVGLPAPEVNGTMPPRQGGMREAWAYMLHHPRLQLAALACVCLGAVKESFTLWTPTYLSEMYQFGITQAAANAIWLPLAGGTGVMLAGWISHRFFRSEEAPVGMGLFAGLALAVALYRPLVAAFGFVAIPVALGLIGVLSNGANGLLLTALPMTQSGEGRVSSAAGFLDFSNYAGAGIGGILSGIMADHWGWRVAFGFWIAVATLGMLVMAAIWRRRYVSQEV